MREMAKKEFNTMFDVLENPDNYSKVARMKYTKLAIKLINQMPDSPIVEADAKCPCPHEDVRDCEFKDNNNVCHYKRTG